MSNNSENYYNRDRTYNYKACFWSMIGIIGIITIILLF
jgi:hypothetical protein